jgi:glyoxylase I family protein
MQATAPVREPLANRPDPAFPRVHGLHHVAYRCKDAEETRHFYEDILRLPLIAIVTQDTVPSTGEYCPYFHLFFELADGSCVAFFDLFDGQATAPDPATPAWVNHLALQVANDADLDEAHKRLVAAGVEVLGPIDHKNVHSIYFFDPNGIRLELTCVANTPAIRQKRMTDARELMKRWSQIRKETAARLEKEKAASAA